MLQGETVMPELYGQLAGVSAVLGGFAITFLALLLGHKERGRCLSASVGVTTVAAAGLLVSALGWTLMGSFLTQTGAQQGGTVPVDSSPAWVAGAHQMLSGVFVCGLAFLFATLGLSGWLRSKALGVLSTVVSAGAALAVWYVLRHMVG